MSVECALKTMATETDKKPTNLESEVELKVQLDLADKELFTLKSNMAALDEENERLHKVIFELENKIKEQERLLKVAPEPSSPRSYYEDKIKDLIKATDELKCKLLDKENELVQVYGQLQCAGNHDSLKLRKTRSLDSGTETEYNVVVDLKRQLELSKQEIVSLRERISEMGAITVTCQNCDKRDKECKKNPEHFTGLAVAYIETEEEENLKTKINLLEVSKRLLEENIAKLANTLMSFSKLHIPEIHKQLISNIFGNTNPSKAIESCSVCATDDEKNFTARELGRAYLPGVQNPGRCIPTPSDTPRHTAAQTNVLSRDPDTLLFIIEQAFCELVKRFGEMNSEKGKEVVPGNDKVSPEVVVPSDMNVSSDSQAWETLSESSDNTEDFYSAKSDISTPTNGELQTSRDRMLNSDDSMDLPTPTGREIITESLDNSQNNAVSVELVDSENNQCQSDDLAAREDIRDSEKVTSSVNHDIIRAEDSDSIQMLKAKIAYLDEEVGK